MSDKAKKNVDRTPNSHEMIPKKITIEELFSEPLKQIKLDAFIIESIRQFLERMEEIRGDEKHPAKEVFAEKLDKYQQMSNDLQRIVILLVRWSNNEWNSREHAYQIERIFMRLVESVDGQSKYKLWQYLSWCPIQYLFYLSGITALAIKNYKMLRVILEVNILDPKTEEEKPLGFLASNRVLQTSRGFNEFIFDSENKFPVSAYLYETLQVPLNEILFLGNQYERLFDRFEILNSLICKFILPDSSIIQGKYIQQYCNAESYRKHEMDVKDPFTLLIQEAQKQRENWEPIQAGLFDGSIKNFLECANNFKKEILEK